MKDWCVYSIDGYISAEIKERAEANGLDVSNIKGNGIDIYYSCWNGVVDVEYSLKVATVTINDLRKMLPLPHEKEPVVWDGEGNPPLGIVCQKCINPLMLTYYKVKIHAYDSADGRIIYEYLDGPEAGKLDKSHQYVHPRNVGNIFKPVNTKPISKREVFVTEIIKLLHEYYDNELTDKLFGEFYDKFLGDKK